MTKTDVKCYASIYMYVLMNCRYIPLGSQRKPTYNNQLLWQNWKLGAS